MEHGKKQKQQSPGVKQSIAWSSEDATCDIQHSLKAHMSPSQCTAGWELLLLVKNPSQIPESKVNNYGGLRAAQPVCLRAST
eukprot:364189-Chlamydomonas_euryale.AAC.27